MTEEEKKVIEYFKKSFTSKTPPYWYDDTIENSEIKIKTLVNLIEKLQKENEEKDKIIFQARDYVEPLVTEYEDGDYSIKEYCKSYIVNELLKGIFNKQYIYKGRLREIITKPAIITDNDDYISVGKIIELLEED